MLHVAWRAWTIYTIFIWVGHLSWTKPNKCADVHLQSIYKYAITELKLIKTTTTTLTANSKHSCSKKKSCEQQKPSHKYHRFHISVAFAQCQRYDIDSNYFFHHYFFFFKYNSRLFDHVRAHPSHYTICAARTYLIIYLFVDCPNLAWQIVYANPRSQCIIHFSSTPPPPPSSIRLNWAADDEQLCIRFESKSNLLVLW